LDDTISITHEELNSFGIFFLCYVQHCNKLWLPGLQRVKPSTVIHLATQQNRPFPLWGKFGLDLNHHGGGEQETKEGIAVGLLVEGIQKEAN
jgi:hypothetical protein